MPTQRRKDPSSFANNTIARVVDTKFEIDVDFDTHILTWWCQHTVRIEQEGASEVILDTRDLDIKSCKVNGKDEEINPGTSTKALGSSIKITLPEGLKVGETCSVDLEWTSSPEAVAAQWLEPSQTAGGKDPYLFTQCQAIHARSLCPCQDTPGAKFTYSAAVRVPSNLVALMSALSDDTADTGADLKHIPLKESVDPASCKVYRFKQPLPISSYLLALAVGNLVSKDLSPISRVWSEPETVEAAAFEFADTPKFLQVAESLAGPYRWGRYDLLLLPPSFPYGGMENVNLTFVTPTLLAGDRSLANVVAHEIAHSWTGNLVTNFSWESFWLNEGNTMYLERRIQGELEGEKAFEFHASQGWGELKETVEHWGKDHPATCLSPDLSRGIDPDDYFGRIPYEKGFALIAYLERLVGGKDVYLPFFKEYIKHFAKTPLTSEDFRKFFMEYFRSSVFKRDHRQRNCDTDLHLAKGVTAIDEIDWDTWLYKPGMPPVTLQYDETLAEASNDLAARWHTSDIMGIGGDGPPGAGPQDIEGWSSAQIVAFLDKLAELRSMSPMAPKTCNAMSKVYPMLETTKNSEIRCAWYLLCLKAGWQDIVPTTAEFLKAQGRMKFVRPLYRAMYNSSKLEGGKETALKIFEECKDKYHPICRKMVAVDLNLVKDGGREQEV